MNRRNFLNALIGTAAGFALDPERALWTKTKTIFVPSDTGRFMSSLELQYRTGRLGPDIGFDWMMIDRSNGPSRTVFVRHYVDKDGALRTEPISFEEFYKPAFEWPPNTSRVAWPGCA